MLPLTQNNMPNYTTINTIKHKINIFKILIGLVFIFSGFVKGVDPLGTNYKVTDYFNAFHIGVFEPLSFTFPILLNMSEFLLGIGLLLVVFPSVFIFMAVFVIRKSSQNPLKFKQQCTIHDFLFSNNDGENVTDVIIYDRSFVFLAISHKLNKASANGLKKLKVCYEYSPIKTINYISQHLLQPKKSIFTRKNISSHLKCITPITLC
ncbi:hypothetical protein OAA06_01965 [bacterium]|nr:hypothetical protein [bacterium]